MKIHFVFIGGAAMSKINGIEITKVFRYVQKVFKECQQLIYKTDSLMAPEWNNIYGSRITRDVTASLQDPERWLVEAIFRVYEDKNNKDVNKAITISFWNEEDKIVEPIITAGKIYYSDISKRNHWDLWSMWFVETDNNNEIEFKLDGTVNIIKPVYNDYISKAEIFSYPLVEIEDDNVLEKKIIEKLKKL